MMATDIAVTEQALSAVTLDQHKTSKPTRTTITTFARSLANPTSKNAAEGELLAASTPPLPVVTHVVPPPSAKALGKRPERASSTIPAAPSPLNPNAQPPSSSNSALPKPRTSKVPRNPAPNDDSNKRRVLPARSRRGGPGIGSSPVDAMILESQQRSAESQYIVSPWATFLLTTDSASLPEPSPSSSKHQSHFDKPEVIQATKIQKIIETPSFSLLDDTDVGSRLRVRVEEVALDTSDAVYERRHRKYEAFEKRQRRREKEKLQHEQYKLKERIDELRSMDVTAFVIGGASLADAEEKKKGMLKEAEELDRRYSVLLPMEKKGHALAASAKATTDTGTPVPMDLDDELSLASTGGEPKIRLRIRRGQRPPSLGPSQQAEQAMTDDEQTDDLDDIEKPESEDEVGHSVGGRVVVPTLGVPEAVEPDHPPPPPLAPKPKRQYRPRIVSAPAQIWPDDHESPRKRTRLDRDVALANNREGSSSPDPKPGEHHPKITSPVRPAGWVPVILRNAPKSNANKTTLLNLRRSMPFNVKIAPSVDAKKEFELPRWIVRPFEDRHLEEG